MPYYAQINNSNIVTAVTETSESIASDSMVLLSTLDESVLGKLYSNGNFSEPAPTEVPTPIYEKYIDLGPFYDRFGSAKLPVLTSTDAGVKAIISDLNIRKWVDLARPDVAQALQYVGTVEPAVTTQRQDSILNTPVTPEENLASRKLYFS